MPVLVRACIQTDPHISGPRVVFTDYSSGRGPDVWYADIETGAQYVIASGDNPQYAIAISNSDVVYNDWSGLADIFLYDIANGSSMYLGGNGQSGATVSRRLVAWEDISRVDDRGNH